MKENYYINLTSLIRKSKIKVLGQDDIKNEAQAKAACAILQSFGNSPSGFLYMEPCNARSTTRPPDILLCHPEIGLLLIEVKGHSIGSIQGLEAGNFIIRSNGFNRPMNPFRQAEDSMFVIEDAVRRKIRDRDSMPLFNYMVAFPNISEAEWISHGFNMAVPMNLMLFSEDIDNSSNLKQKISKIVKETLQTSHKESPLSQSQIIAIQHAFGDSAVINEYRSMRPDVEEKTLGGYIDELACMEKYLSSEQQELSRLNIKGYQRLIRGVAGSGKTVVLANMVSRFVSRKGQSYDLFPDDTPILPRIQVACFNRSLVQFIYQKIKDSYAQQCQEDLPSNTVSVNHLNGLVYQLSKDGILNYISTKNNSINSAQRAIDYQQQLHKFAATHPDWYQSILYDALFIDEGQDLVPEEFQLLLDLVKPDPQTFEKTLVVFYDDAQNLYARPRPNWKQIGIDVQRGDRSRVMKECFRNTREIVELAFNILLGSKANPDTRVMTRTYADVNYLKQQNMVEEKDNFFNINFAERTFKKPTIHKFTTRSQEKDWIASEIARLIEKEKIRPEDILVLFHRKDEFQDLGQLIQGKLKNTSVKGFIKPYGGGKDSDLYIFREHHITISTTHGAKGYDAYVVFLVGVDLFTTDNEGRASFYVGATRAKLILYISGLNNGSSLISEAVSVLNAS